MLAVNDLRFAYKRKTVLQNIRFKARTGEITAVLGPNGVGKTTLLKCLNRILIPDKGDVQVNGTPLSRMPVRDVARHIAYVAQTGELARITAFDAILMGRKPHMGFRTGKADLEKVDAVIRHLNLTDLTLKTLDQMSGGERQKVCIARALAQETGILLLDEPTASLDLKNQTHILNLIRHIVKDHDMTCVVTIHDLNTALRYADRFVFLKDKTVYAAGRVREVTPEMISQVYGIRVDIVYHKGWPLVIPLETRSEPLLKAV